MDNQTSPSDTEKAVQLRRRLKIAVGNLEIAQKNVTLLRDLYSREISKFEIGDIIEWDAGKIKLTGAVEGIKYYDMESPRWIVRWNKRDGSPSERVTEVCEYHTPRKVAVDPLPED